MLEAWRLLNTIVEAKRVVPSDGKVKLLGANTVTALTARVKALEDTLAELLSVFTEEEEAAEPVNQEQQG